ncbi:MAG: DUF11 domain-containing protein [Chloroflexi bacterium]|nr:DUF11 domain-containing protein [Chloroflexota bacterium]
MGEVRGAPGSSWEGISAHYNTADSACNQEDPDAIRAGDALSRVLLVDEMGTPVGLAATTCGHRVIYFSFGLEGVGPLSARSALIERALDVLMTGDLARERPKLFFPLSLKAAIAGTTVDYPFSVVNTSAVGRQVVLTPSSPWQVEVIDPISQQPISTTATLTSCGSMELRLRVQVPADAPFGAMPTTLEARFIDSEAPGTTSTVDTLVYSAWQAAQGHMGTPEPRYRWNVVANDCHLYAVGGFEQNDEPTGKLDILDLTSGVWQEGAPRPHVAGNGAAVELNGLIYVLGGYNGALSQPFLSAVDIYDPASDSWRPGPELPRPLAGLAAAAWGGRIYVFGGAGPEGVLDRGYRLDPQAEIWEEITGPPGGGVEFASAVATAEGIYLLGGWPARRSCYRYDPTQDRWVVMAPMHQGRHSLAVGEYAGVIYVAGGGIEWNSTATVERLDPQRNEWVSMPPLDLGNRLGAAGAVVGGRFYVLGGADGLETLPLGGAGVGSYIRVESTAAQPGDRLLYALMLRNPSDAGVLVTWIHRVPDVLQLVPGSLPSDVRYYPGPREITWQGWLAAQQERRFDFAADVSDALEVKTIVTSEVKVDVGVCEPITLTTRVLVSRPSLNASTKSVTATRALPGERLHYEILVENDTPFPIPLAQITDSLPAGTFWVPDSLVGGTWNGERGQIEWRGALPGVEPFGPSFHWYDATGGRRLDLEDDSCTGPVDLGFPFEFYGRRYTAIYVNSNGMVLFEECSSRYTNTPIPDMASPNAFVAPLWDDLVPRLDGGNVYVATYGTAPRRYTVVEWHDVQVFAQDVAQTFEVVFFEGTNRILCQYLELTGDRGHGSSATVGLEGPEGKQGVLYLYQGEPPHHRLTDRMALELRQPSTRPESAQRIAYDVQIDPTLPPAGIGAENLVINEALIHDGLNVIRRVVTTTVGGPSFERSSKIGPAEALEGEVLTYTLELINTGELKAQDVLLVDPLPPELALVEGTLQGMGAWYDAENRQVRWAGTLAPTQGEEGVTLSYAARVAHGLGVNYWLTNAATIYERGVAMRRLEASTRINAVNLEVIKTADRAQVYPGEVISYTILLRNVGRYPASGVEVLDSAVEGLLVLTETLRGGIWDEENRAIVWRGDLPPGAEQRLDYCARPGPEVRDGTVLTNTVQVNDGTGAFLRRQASVRVRRGDLSSSAMVVTPQEVMPGQAVTVTAYIRNQGSASALATLRVMPEASLVLVEQAPFASSGQARIEGGALLWQGVVVPQGMVVVRFRARVAFATGAGDQRLTGTLQEVDGLATTLAAPFTVRAVYREFMPLVRR